MRAAHGTTAWTRSVERGVDGVALENSYSASSGRRHAWRLQGDLLMVVVRNSMRNVTILGHAGGFDARFRRGRNSDLDSGARGRRTRRFALGPDRLRFRRGRPDFLCRHLAGQKDAGLEQDPALAALR